MASEEHKMAFAEHARKGGAGLRVFPRSTETYRPRRKNIMNSIFRQNVFAKNNALQITYISPRLPQRFVLFCFFFVSPQRVYPFWNSNSKQIPFSEFKFHCRNSNSIAGTRVTVNAIKCHFLEHRTTRGGTPPGGLAGLRCEAAHREDGRLCRKPRGSSGVPGIWLPPGDRRTGNQYPSWRACSAEMGRQTPHPPPEVSGRLPASCR